MRVRRSELLHRSFAVEYTSSDTRRRGGEGTSGGPDQESHFLGRKGRASAQKQGCQPRDLGARSARPPPFHEPITSTPRDLSIGGSDDIGFVASRRPLTWAATGVCMLSSRLLVRLVPVDRSNRDDLIDAVDRPDRIRLAGRRGKTAQPFSMIVARGKYEDDPFSNALADELEIGMPLRKVRSRAAVEGIGVRDDQAFRKAPPDVLPQQVLIDKVEVARAVYASRLPGRGYAL